MAEWKSQKNAEDRNPSQNQQCNIVKVEANKFYPWKITMALVWDDTDDRNFERFIERLLSRGYDEHQAHRTAIAYTSLREGTAQLVRFEQGLPENMDFEEGELVAVGTTGNTRDSVLLHDDILLPEWIQFAGAMASAVANYRGYINLILANVQLGQAVSDMLLQSFNRAPLRSLTLVNNGLGSHGINFVVGVLENNPRIERLGVSSNDIESARDAESLVSAVNGHPTLYFLNLHECRNGQDNAVMSAIVPSLCHLAAVSLEGNCIRSDGAMLISNCLASNPHVKLLMLNGNFLNDDDAEVLAKSLKKNTNLRWLDLSENCITQAGTETLIQAVHSQSSLNNLYDANHTCSIIVSEDIGDFLKKANGSTYTGLNRKRKILHALLSYSSRCTNLECLDDVPVKTMPRVLALLQDKIIFTSAGRLEALFCFIRERGAPLLDTSSIGPKLRRSERIRKRTFIQLMEK